MSALWLAIIGLATVIATVVMRHRHAAAAAALLPAQPARKAAPSGDAGSVVRGQEPGTLTPNRAGSAPADPSLEWETPVLDLARKSDDTGATEGSRQPANELRNAQRAKIRDRYLAARFPGAARTAADLQQTERVIQSARLYFEERKLDRAIELLGLAIEQCPGEEALRLARLEIAFLMRDAALYVALANDLRGAHPSSPQWSEVARLGRSIAPDEALFGAAGDPHATNHYGPWPDMPNWMHAPWDLTAEVRATEFHQAMARRAA